MEKKKNSKAGGKRRGSGRKPSIATFRVIDELMKRPKGVSASNFADIEFADGEKIPPSTANAILVRLEQKGFLDCEKQGEGRHIKNVYFVNEYKQRDLSDYQASILNKAPLDKEDYLLDLKSEIEKSSTWVVFVLFILVAIIISGSIYAVVRISKAWHSQVASLTTLSNVAFSQLNLDQRALKLTLQEELDSFQFLTESTINSLKSLDLSESNITDLAPLVFLTQLENLDLSDTVVSDLRPLSELRNLRVLDISYSEVQDIDVLFNLGLKQLSWKDGDAEKIAKLRVGSEGLIVDPPADGLIMATGDVLSESYSLGRVISRNMEDAGEDFPSIFVEPIGNPNQSLEGLIQGKYQLAVVPSDIAYKAYELERASDGNLVSILRTVIALPTELQPIHLVCHKGVEVGSVNDIEGKSIGIGAVGSTVYNMALDILSAIGVDPIGVFVVYGGSDILIDFHATKIDCFFYLSSVGGQVLKNIAENNEVVIISLQDEALLSMVNESSPYFPLNIPAGTYKGINKPVVTFAVKDFLFTTTKVSDEDIYRVVKVVVSNPNVFTDSSTLEDFSEGDFLNFEGFSLPLHDGVRMFSLGDEF